MTHASAQLFDAGLDHFDAVASQLAADDWQRPSPCAGWTALDVLGHLGTALSMGASLLKGEQPRFAEVASPSELVEGEPYAWWRAQAEEVRAALEGADLDLVMDTPMGPRTVADRLAFPAIDLYVHAWDIGRAAGIDVTIPDAAIEFAHGYIDPLPPEMVRASGVMAPEVDAPADASPTDAFIAWCGRDPR
jgi:uncharacterized protein (TIGR03086 family)